ncbi:MAG: hypothetical protein AAFO94_10815, partial [Bacteroidota bacterium]
IPQEEIDKVKWNSCVHYANNGNVFGYMWYLNNTAKDWDGLVEGDYESVFPITWKETGWPKRKVFQQPTLIREMGPYTIHAISRKRIQLFMEAIPETYQDVRVRLSEQIGHVTDLDFTKVERVNHQLLLTEQYETIADQYQSDFFRLLEKATEAQLRPSGTLKPEKLIDFYKRYNQKEMGSEQNYHAYLRIMYNVLHRGWGFASGVEDGAGELMAVSFFVYSHNKVMRLFSVASPKGKENGALAYAYDLLVRSHAGRPMILDFNTISDNPIPLSMGAQENIYYELSRSAKKWKIF